MRDRAVSEVIGFVLVFSLVLLTLSVVYVAGFGGLEDARGSERLNNAERAFDVFGDNVADIYGDGVPSRKTEIKLAEAQLSYGEPTTFNVTVENVTDGGGNLIIYEASTRPLVFSTGGPSKLVYENGAVIRSDRGGAILRRPPPLLIEQNRTIVNYVVLTKARGTTNSVGGEGTVLVRTVRRGQTMLVQERNNTNVRLRIETATERAAVWEQYVNERADWSGSDWEDGDNVPCETTDLGDGRSRVVCTLKPDEFYLASTGIKTEFVT